MLGAIRAQELPADAVFGTTVVRPFGLRGDIYLLKPGTAKLPDFGKLEPIGAIYTTYLKVPPRNVFTLGFPGVEHRYEWFAIDYNGRFYVDVPGKYEFGLISDDGSKLYIDGRVVINNDGLHSSLGKTGDIKLGGGIHTIRVSYFEGPCFNQVNPCVELQLGVKRPGSTQLKYFSTDDFSAPANPADWKYGSPDDIKDAPDPNIGRRRLRDELKKAGK